MKKSIQGATLSMLFVIAIGCGSKTEAPVAEGSATTPVAGSDGKTINGAKVVNKPTSDIPEGGIVLQPPNPNDPKYQPDPRLSGGR